MINAKEKDLIISVVKKKDRSGDFLSVSAEYNGWLAGYCLLHYGIHGTDGKLPLVSNLKVAVAYRKNGIASALINKCIALSNEEGCYSLSLDTKRSNKATVALCLSLGFIPVVSYDGYEEIRFSLPLNAKPTVEDIAKHQA